MPLKNLRSFLCEPLNGFVFFSSLFIFFASFFCLYKFDFYSLYISLLLLGWLGLNFFLGQTDTSNQRSLTKLEISTIALITIAMFMTRYILIQHSIFWLDEYMQLKSVTDKGNTISFIASIHQQPPLGYLFNYFLTLFTGYSLKTVHLLALIPALAATIYISKQFIIRLGILPAIAVSIYFLLNPDWSYHSIEGRPLALSIFCAFLWFFSAVDYLNKQNRTRLFKFGLMAFFYFNTIALQSNFLLLSSTLSLLAIFAFNRDEKKYLHLGLANIASVIVSIPIQYLIYSNSTNFILNEPLSTRLSNYIEQLSLYSIYNYSTFFSDKTINLAFISIIILSLIFLSIFKKQEFFKKITICVLSSVFFIILFELFFALKINWIWQSRYIETWRTLVIVASFLAIASLTIKPKLKYLSSCLLILLTLSNYAQSDGFIASYENETLPNYRKNWKELFESLEEYAQKDLNIIFIADSELGNMFPTDWSVGTELWASDKLVDKLKMNVLRENQINLLDTPSIVVLLQLQWHKFPLQANQHFNVSKVKQFQIIAPNNSQLHGVEILKYLRDNRRVTPQTHRSLIYLMEYSLYKNDLVMLEKNYLMLQDILKSTSERINDPVAIEVIKRAKETLKLP